MTDAQLALLGHLIGDGCTLPRHAIQYTTADLPLADTVVQLARQAFGDSVTPRIVRERRWYQVYLAASARLTHGRRNPVAAWLDSLGAFGLRAWEKAVPDKVFEQPAEQIALFLRHLWSTDGCIHMGTGETRIPRIYYASSSVRLARDVQSLLLRLGINARVSGVAQRDRGRKQHHVVISGQHDLRVFIDLVGALRPSAVVHATAIRDHIDAQTANTNRDVIPASAWRDLALPALAAAGATHRSLAMALGTAYNGNALYKSNLSRERTARVAEAVGCSTLQDLANSDVYWDQVTSIEPAGSEDVYDLTVDDLHNFVAADMIVHNSIEQDADIVLFLYREGMHNQEIDKSQTLLIVAKNRNGPVRDIDLVFHAEQTSFREPYRGRPE
jgi:replicative DNA helicase